MRENVVLLCLSFVSPTLDLCNILFRFLLIFVPDSLSIQVPVVLRTCGALWNLFSCLLFWQCWARPDWSPHLVFPTIAVNLALALTPYYLFTREYIRGSLSESAFIVTVLDVTFKAGLAIYWLFLLPRHYKPLIPRATLLCGQNHFHPHSSAQNTRRYHSTGIPEHQRLAALCQNHERVWIEDETGSCNPSLQVSDPTWLR